MHIAITDKNYRIVTFTVMSVLITEVVRLFNNGEIPYKTGIIISLLWIFIFSLILISSFKHPRYRFLYAFMAMVNMAYSVYTLSNFQSPEDYNTEITELGNTLEIIQLLISFFGWVITTILFFLSAERGEIIGWD